MNNTKWVFRELEGAGFEGPNSGSGDHFKGTKLSSLVRELVQNSMDQITKKKETVKIVMDLKKVSAKSFNGFYGIWPHVDACHSYQKTLNKNNNTWQLRYKNSLDEYRNNEDVSILCFHDSNTTGLNGPIDGTPKGPFHAIKAQGLSAKQGEGSGGSYGHGAVAALLYSGVRGVFYYSQVDEEPKERFFGKVILQSHKHPHLEGNPYTRSFGYYGHDDKKISPLIDKEVPSWAKEFREEHQLGVGCSVYVPYTYFKKDLYPETIISLIANFYMAFKNKKLEAQVGGVKINYKNLNDVYDRYRKKFDRGEEEDDIDVDYIEECFKSVDTIRNCNKLGFEKVPGFGKIEWYLRISNNLKWRKVGVSRRIGMLITRKAKYLDQFSGFKYFDMFVCVRGDDGNDILQKLENPQHTEFELNRINDLPNEEKDRIIKGYKRFTKKVRDILKQYASTEISEEEDVDELAELFGEYTNTDDVSKDIERGIEIQISDAPLPSSKSTTGSKKVSGKLGKGSGKRGGEGKNKKPGGSNEGEIESTVVGDGPLSATEESGKKLNIQNLRVGNISSNGKRVTLYFDPPKAGKFNLRLSKIGELESDYLEFDNKKKSQKIEINKKRRAKIDLVMSEDISSFVLRGELNEIKH